MDMGKFPWAELVGQTLSIVMAYFAGRYRNSTKNQTRRKDDVV